MNSLTDSFVMHNGVHIPCVGFGTWQTPNDETGLFAVKEALVQGYRHIDTAAGYQNEECVGQAVTESGIPRDQLFITSKLRNDEHGYDATMAAFDRTMKNLGMDVLDLFLIHWPNPLPFRSNWEKMNAETWKAFEELYEAGRIRSIGVSNFMPHHLDALMKTARIVPMVNQIRLCPGEVQAPTVAWCRKNKVVVEAYSPLGTGKVFKIDAMKALAEKYGKSIAQICLRWSLQMDFLPLPKSVTADRIQENTRIFDFELSEDDVEMIAAMTEACGPSADPDKVSF